jgi:hypothetical protein
MDKRTGREKTANYGAEDAYAPIKTIDTSVDPEDEVKIIVYSESPGACERGLVSWCSASGVSQMRLAFVTVSS